MDEASGPRLDKTPIQVGGIYFVIVSDKMETYALWRSEGTPEGTFLLKRTCIFDLTSFLTNDR
jgi:hypothetical protein